MQRTEPFEDILSTTLTENLGKDFFTELTAEEQVQELIHGDNDETNYYRKFCFFIKNVMLPQEG